MLFLNKFWVLVVYLLSLTAFSQNEFNYETCSVYGDSISSRTAAKHIREGRPILLVQEGCTSEKRAEYVARKYAEFIRILDDGKIHESIKTQLKKNCVVPPGNTEKKYHFRYVDVYGRCVSGDSVKAYNKVVKGFLTRKYGRKWRKNEFGFRF